MCILCLHANSITLRVTDKQEQLLGILPSSNHRGKIAKKVLVESELDLVKFMTLPLVLLDILSLSNGCSGSSLYT